jgi:hypothetical protein
MEAWAVRAADGEVFTFEHDGTVQGTISGFNPRRDDDFVTSGSNAMLARDFANIQNGATARVSLQASWDLGAMWSTLQNDLGYVEQVIAVAGKVIAAVGG